MKKDSKLSFATTEAGDDWLRYGRPKTSKKKKDQKKAAAMDNSEMVTVKPKQKAK